MNAKNAERTLIVLIVILLAIASFLYATDAGAAGYSFSEVNAGSTLVGGDCFANRASGDFYPNGQNSSHCELGNTVRVDKPAKEDKPADVVTDVPATDDTPAVDDTPETPVQDKPEDKPEDKPADQKGNPGNDKSVGNAGEKCDKGMCENADQKTGEHGKSKND